MPQQSQSHSPEMDELTKIVHKLTVDVEKLVLNQDYLSKALIDHEKRIRYAERGLTIIAGIVMAFQAIKPFLVTWMSK